MRELHRQRFIMREKVERGIARVIDTIDGDLAAAKDTTCRAYERSVVRESSAGHATSILALAGASGSAACTPCCDRGACVMPLGVESCRAQGGHGGRACGAHRAAGGVRGAHTRRAVWEGGGRT